VQETEKFKITKEKDFRHVQYPRQENVGLTKAN